MQKKKELILIIHNVRSAHNVGSLFRTADGAGVAEIILTGYTAKPPKKDALHLTAAEKAFQKTALWAEGHISWRKAGALGTVLTSLRKDGWEIIALEQHTRSVGYLTYKPKRLVALLVGNEVRGVDAKILKRCDRIIDIPMRGHKHSLNVSVAAGIALYHITSTIEK
ncbi:MAG: hypothetical protein A3E38_02865 [Candidatus Moranbacteria bacterium RIFCSPHIGHO2_12_FULL_54_9]|nr:MAG: hypothetical protein A2878_03580 [Candidatus Moranbacteria bacterium RIFCSPHIGHO2_01_FULL_54_31]OGI25467.1 MAG: hypothetical protein A3E38_02865 [Candidatus Moranbacteria bacterium RIFCSPHIGHO2_12_FULL_54_9]